ncbi:MAG: sugar kinase [Christensenellaceae bacterium]|jgi:2-dehydro-3-deoxygluconokinase
MIDVLLMGEPMVLFGATTVAPLEEVEEYKRFLAGAEVNVAIGLSRLEHTPAYVTRLGDDPFAKFIIHSLKQDNIETEYITIDDRYLTGFQLKGKVLAGDPPVAYFRKNSAASHLSVADIEKIDFDTVKRVHVTGISPALSPSCMEATLYLVQTAKERGIPVSYDPNLRPVLWKDETAMRAGIHKIAPYANLILPGISEGKLLTKKETPEEIAAFYHDMGIETVVIKLGGEGAYASGKEGAFYQAGFQVKEVVDTVGAGDAFAVGMLSSLLEGLSLKETVIRANAIGSMQIVVPGDNDGLPTREELEAFFLRERK